MNTKRIVGLGLALVAAIGVALLVRGMMGGGTPKVAASVAPPQVKMSEVLVASEAMQPGQKLDATKLRWESWPAKAVDASFITHEAVASIDDAVKNTVVRAPILANQPITSSAIVHADTAGFMAARLQPGMRAISITINTDSGAGGFILPNDRVDVMMTQKSAENPPRVRILTVLSAVRVLAVDQVFKEEKDQKTVVAKSATLELTPAQAELVTKAAAMGQLSLALRPLNTADDAALSAGDRPSRPDPRAQTVLSDNFGGGGSGPAKPSGPLVIRYGVPSHAATSGNASDQNTRMTAQ